MARKPSHHPKLALQMSLGAPSEDAYGLEVVCATGLPAGSANATLRRLEDEGLLDSPWKRLDSGDTGRPPRRYFQATPKVAAPIARQSRSEARCAHQIVAPARRAALRSSRAEIRAATDDRTAHSSPRACSATFDFDEVLSEQEKAPALQSADETKYLLSESTPKTYNKSLSRALRYLLLKEFKWGAADEQSPTAPGWGTG